MTGYDTGGFNMLQTDSNINS